jgi:hypothetical protein
MIRDKEKAKGQALCRGGARADRETIENLSYWQQNLMSSVLPASKRGLEGAER